MRASTELDYERLKNLIIEAVKPDFLKSLFNENISFEYDASGNITKITKTTKDAQGNTKTITYTFSYDASGNLTSISKVVS